jgi:hypothetical protein
MPLRNISYWIMISLLFTGCQNIFSKAGRSIEKQSKEMASIDSFYSSLQKRYTLIIAYYPYNASSAALTEQHQYVFCYNSLSACTGYIHSKPLVQNIHEQKTAQVDSINVPRDAAAAVLNEFKKSSGWDLNYNDTIEDSADNYCFYKTKKPCFVLHGETYEVVFIFKHTAAVSLLYAPDRYETECCQGNINRQKFIAIKSIMESAFKNGGLAIHP